MKLAVLAVLAFSGACTTLGPMPATTGVSAMPIGRPGVDAQVGGVPGFYASQSARNDAKGTPIQAGSALLDLDRWLPMKGVLVGGRIFGDKIYTGEPFIGYRRTLVSSVGLAVIGFGSTKRAESNLATFHGVRLGTEAAVDAELWKPSPWIALHAQGAASLTRILASGRYCLDANGIAKDCNVSMPETNTFASARTVDVYPAATATLALEIGTHEGFFDRVRVAMLGSVGRMPLVANGEQTGTGTYVAIGLSISAALGLGAAAGE